MTDNTKMREAFEKFAMKEGMILDMYKLSYLSDETYSAWKAWQAAQMECKHSESVPVEDVVLPIASAYESGIGHCNDNLCNPYKTGSAEAYAYDYGKEFGKSRGISQPVPMVGEPVADAAKSIASMVVEWVQIGIKNGNWQEGLPSLIERRLQRYWPTHSIPAAELERLRKDAERYQAVMIISQAALCLPSTRTDEANRMLSAYQAAVNAGLGIEPAIDAAIAQGKEG